MNCYRKIYQDRRLPCKSPIETMPTTFDLVCNNTVQTIVHVQAVKILSICLNQISLVKREGGARQQKLFHSARNCLCQMTAISIGRYSHILHRIRIYEADVLVEKTACKRISSKSNCNN